MAIDRLLDLLAHWFSSISFSFSYSYVRRLSWPAVWSTSGSTSFWTIPGSGQLKPLDCKFLGTPVTAEPFLFGDKNSMAFHEPRNLCPNQLYLTHSMSLFDISSAVITEMVKILVSFSRFVTGVLLFFAHNYSEFNSSFTCKFGNLQQQSFASFSNLLSLLTRQTRF